MKLLFTELKRRNVIRVGAAYLVASWLIIQVVGVMIDILEVPNWIGKLLLILLALGFPLTLLFAWAFEITAEGVKAEADVDRSASITGVTGKKLDMITIGLVIMAMAVFVGDRLLYSDGMPIADVVVTSTPGGSLQASVAVLPFENISQDAKNEPFTIGIHDDLLTQISKIRSIRTISRSSVLPYRASSKRIQEIASELNVATILEGGVQRAGDRVRINVQLIDAQTSDQLWAERYERQLTAANIFVIQSEIVIAIAEELQTTLSPDEQQRIESIPTENLAALDLYFLGRQRIAERTTDAFEQAIQHFQKAIELDPDFALAYVGLSDSYQLQEDAGGLPRNEMFAKAEPLLEKALELDSELGAAYTSLGALRWTAGNYPDAETMFRKSIELSPNYATTYLWYGLMLVDWGRIEEATAMYRQGIERDPLSSQLNESLGISLEFDGRFDDALILYQRAVDLNSTFSTSYMTMGNIHWMAAGRINQAVACHKKSIDMDPGARLTQTWHGLLYLDLGDVPQAEQWISSALRLAPESLEPQAAMALLDLYRGNNTEALSHAAAAQQLNPYYSDARKLQSMALALLRNHELREGRLDAARDWYSNAYSALLDDDGPVIGLQNYRSAIDLAYLLQQTGDEQRATLLLNRSLTFLDNGTISRLGIGGYGIADVQIYALSGESQRALAALRQAIDQGWRGLWWFDLNNNPNLESLHENAEYQAMVQEVESLMITQQSTLGQSGTCSNIWAYDSAHGW